MEPINTYKMIGVMCGSSDACDKKYLEMAYQLGHYLAEHEFEVVYGGGAKGLMGKVADGALDGGTAVHGYMPNFMIEVEWQHQKLTHLHMTADMSERKFKMMNEVDATLFLPGGCGTMEEFFEWLSAKRLGKHLGPLLIFNFDGYYDPLIKLLNQMEAEKFHNSIHTSMWTECKSFEDIIPALSNEPKWDDSIISQASVK